MNQELTLAEAKDVIKDKIISYLEVNDVGQYVIPVENQNPIFLKSRPGIGKTTVMKEIVRELASEENIHLNFLAYDISHMLLSNMVGLPTVRTADFSVSEGGEEQMEMTVNTVPDIVRSVHRAIKKTGYQQGLLFLDEINCCSESLFRILLTLLQSKKIANYRIPDGWVLVCAGNSNEDNHSAREFDGAILDRLFCLDIVPDYESWRSYAVNNGVHPDIIGFLDSAQHNGDAKDTFYNVGLYNASQVAVTPRSWVDLSLNLKSAAYKRGMQRYTTPQDRFNFARKFIHGNICHPEIADKFTTFHINSLSFNTNIDDETLTMSPENNLESINNEQKKATRQAQLDKIKSAYENIETGCLDSKRNGSADLSFYLGIIQHLADYENNLINKFTFYYECFSEVKEPLYNVCSPVMDEQTRRPKRVNGQFVFTAPPITEIVGTIDKMIEDKQNKLQLEGNTLSHDEEYRTRFMLKFLDKLKLIAHTTSLREDVTLQGYLSAETLDALEKATPDAYKGVEGIYLAINTELLRTWKDYCTKSSNYDANIGGLLNDVFSKSELYNDTQDLVTIKSLMEAGYKSTLLSNIKAVLYCNNLGLHTLQGIVRNSVNSNSFDSIDNIYVTAEFDEAK